MYRLVASAYLRNRNFHYQSILTSAGFEEYYSALRPTVIILSSLVVLFILGTGATVYFLLGRRSPKYAAGLEPETSPS